MKILVLHGPNLNLLGQRDPTKYGTITLSEIDGALHAQAGTMGVEIECFQSNHEGALIDFLQRPASRAAHGVLINPGALVRYGYSLRQALVDLGRPVVEVHLSDIDRTGVNRAVNVLDDVRVDKVAGKREASYYEGLRRLVRWIEGENGE